MLRLETTMEMASKASRRRWSGQGRAFALAALFCFNGGILCGQSVTLALGSGSVAPGGSVSLPIILTTTGGANPAALQWTLTYSASDVASVTVGSGFSPVAAKKYTVCNPKPGSIICLLYGMNTTWLTGGTVASAEVQLAKTSSATSIPIRLTGTVAATGDGIEIPSSGVSGIVTVVAQPLASLVCSPLAVAAPGISTCAVSLPAPMSAGVDIELESSHGSLHVPASVRVEAGQSVAQFTVLVDAGAVGQSATLTARTGTSSVQATFTIAGGGEAALLFNAASYSVEYICSPGSVVTAFGSGFTANQTKADLGNLPVQLAGFQVKVNEIAAPLYFVSPAQANFQCPVLDPGLSISIAVGSAKPVVQRKMEAASPGIYYLPDSGAGQGAILIAGTRLAATAGISGRPVQLGEYVEIYANGLGLLDTSWPAGTPAPADQPLRVKNPVLVVLGGIEVEPSFVGLTANSIGLYQVNLQVPFYVPAGDAVPVLLKVFLDDGSVLTSNTVTMAIASAS